MEYPYWSEMIPDLVKGRVEKPRATGLTMIIDTGLPTQLVGDFLQLSSAHIDFWKFGFGSAGVCPKERLMDKISLCQEYDVLAYPGGTTLEIMVAKNRWEGYMEAVREAGMRVIEISDGTIQLSVKKRRELIRAAKKLGFIVLTEVGKKLSNRPLPVDEQVKFVNSDLATGADYVILEGRESGKGVGVFDSEGNVCLEETELLFEKLGQQIHRVIWEAPLVNQQIYFINRLGPGVSFGNIKAFDVVALESLRRGLRSDTMGPALGIEAASDGSKTSLQNGAGPKPTIWTHKRSPSKKDDHSPT